MENGEASEAATGVFCKKDDFKDFANFIGKHGENSWRPVILKKTLAGVSCEYCEIFKNTFSTEYLRATASGLFDFEAIRPATLLKRDSSTGVFL